MGKRLDQQPMYPQYTYYYPHYLQTKVRAGGAGRLAGDGERSRANCGLASSRRRFFCLFLGFAVTRRGAGRQKAGVREAGRLLSALPFISIFLLIYFFFSQGPLASANSFYCLGRTVRLTLS